MSEDAREKTGSFLVTHADETSAVLRNVADGEVHTLGSNPGVDPDDVVEGTVASQPPMEVTWELVELESRRRIPIEQSREPPTSHEQEIAADQPVGEITRTDRAGDGQLHVLTVPEDGTEQAVEDVLSDREMTLSRAARIGVSRVEIRSTPGIVSVRYMP